MALFLDVGPNDVVCIDGTYVTIERKSGQRARLRFVGPADVELVRQGRFKIAELATEEPEHGRGS
jgi:hypothetical protein